MTGEHLGRLASAASDLQDRCPNLDAAKTTHSLSDGLTLLADQLFTRVGRDLEQFSAMDSMLMPATEAGEVRATLRTRTLIDVYSCHVAAAEARAQSYVDDADDWLEAWLWKLRMPDVDLAPVRELAGKFAGQDVDEQRLTFASALERRMPQATKAPLVLYRLYPLAVQIVTTVAFGDHLRAGELRNQQIHILPVISDCHQCHGRPLDNGDFCRTCGNPLWHIEWLSAAD